MRETNSEQAVIVRVPAATAETATLTKEKLFQIVKPLREQGVGIDRAAKLLMRAGYRTDRTEKIWGQAVASACEQFGTKSWNRSVYQSPGRRSNWRAIKEEIVVQKTAEAQDVPAPQPGQTPAPSHYMMLAEIAISNLPAGTKRGLIKTLVADL